MALDLENDEVLSAAIEGLPKVVELITTVPEEQRPLALAAAHESYLQTAQTLGYLENDAEEWASTVMSMLEIAKLANERITQKDHWKVSPVARFARTYCRNWRWATWRVCSIRISYAMLVFDIRTIGDVSSYRQTEIMRSFASPALAPPAWRHRHSSDDFGISKLKPLAYSRRVLLIASDATQRFRNDEFKITCPRRLQHGLNAAFKNQRGASKIASLASSMIDLMRLQPHNRRLPDQSDMVKGVFATAVAALVYISPMIFA